MKKALFFIILFVLVISYVSFPNLGQKINILSKVNTEGIISNNVSPTLENKNQVRIATSLKNIGIFFKEIITINEAGNTYNVGNNYGVFKLSNSISSISMTSNKECFSDHNYDLKFLVNCSNSGKLFANDVIKGKYEGWDIIDKVNEKYMGICLMNKQLGNNLDNSLQYGIDTCYIIEKNKFNKGKLDLKLLDQFAKSDILKDLINDRVKNKLKNSNK